ncbi:MAG: hypothetical protein ACTSWL_05530 [Promethearchaeota archaeon]
MKFEGWLEERLPTIQIHLIECLLFHLYRYTIQYGINIQEIIKKNFEDKIIFRMIQKIKYEIENSPPYQIDYDSWDNSFEAAYEHNPFDSILERNKLDCKLINLEQIFPEKMNLKKKIWTYQTIINDILELAQLIIEKKEN